MRLGKRERIALREIKRLEALQKKYKATIKGNSKGFATANFNPLPNAKKWGFNAKGRRKGKVISIAV